MFHRLQKSTHHFIRSVYFPDLRRSKQKVIVKIRVDEKFDPSSPYMDLLSDAERSYMIDFFKEKEASELETKQQIAVRDAKETMLFLYRAMQACPPAPDDVLQLGDTAKSMMKLMGVLRKKNLEAVGFVKPDSEDEPSLEEYLAKSAEENQNV